MFDTGSNFNNHVAAMFDALGAQLVKHGELDVHVDFIMTATENANVDDVHAPIFYLPHGVGMHKNLPISGKVGMKVSGTVDQLRPNSVVGMSYGSSQNGVLVGDPSYDQMLNSGHLVHVYRKVLGVRQRKLIVIASTWSEHSLMGRFPKLAAELLSQLDYDEYALAIVMHPNIWDYDSALEIERIFRHEVSSGACIIKPDQGWQATLLAADVVIGDHGSLSLYAAAIGKPLLLTSKTSQTTENTVMDTLLDHAPILIPELDIAQQIHAVLALPNLQHIGQRAFPLPRQSLSIIQKISYQRLNLVPLAPPEELPAAKPSTISREPRSFAVYTWVENDAIHVKRIPLRFDKGTEDELHQRYVLSYEDEQDVALLRRATVIVQVNEHDDWDAMIREQFPFVAVTVPLSQAC
jgi:hypothetical protein